MRSRGILRLEGLRFLLGKDYAQRKRPLTRSFHSVWLEGDSIGHLVLESLAALRCLNLALHQPVMDHVRKSKAYHIIDSLPQ